jgi:hypothetical protein
MRIPAIALALALAACAGQDRPAPADTADETAVADAEAPSLDRGSDPDQGAGAAGELSGPARPSGGVQDGPAAPPPAAAQEPVRVEGRITAGGIDHDPQTWLSADGVTYRVRGRLEAELRSLAGAHVAVRGTVAAGRPPSLEAASYAILEIHGARPTVGRILADGRLAADADTLVLLGAPPELRPGDRVWVVGERDGRTLRVSSSGRIAPGG